MNNARKIYRVKDEVNEETIGLFTSYRLALSSAIEYLSGFMEDEYTEVVIEKFQEVRPGKFRRIKRFPYVSKDLCRRKTSEM